ncbi:MAG: glutaminase A [Candidatus Sericytochromatia bacterium]|nr:glutaminase A [Candidatus Sericytochromatia bacterium]
MTTPDRALLEALHRDHLGLSDGAVATYIPELAKADPDAFGLALCTAAGEVLTVGDHDAPFTIQSVSKPFVYGMALDDHGRDAVLARVGVEPTGDAFNSIITLDERSKRPHNPMVNAGAIAVAALTPGAGPTERLDHLLAAMARFTGHRVAVDVSVFMSERSTGHRNRAIAHLMLNFGMVEASIDEALDLYFQQCAMLVTARDLAVMAGTLANWGVNPLTGERALAPAHVRDVLSVMYTCGMYDAAGQWAHDVGLPAKSGVGGGLIAVAPGRFGLAIYAPRLDAHGHSVRGVAVCRALSQRLGLHLFEPR